MYIKSWSFLVTAFKELTEFGIESEKEELKKISIGRRMMCTFKSSLLSTYNLQRDVSLSELIDLLVEEIFKIIPFIGNLPFFSTILSTILGNITNYIIGLIMQRFGLDEISLGDIWGKMKIFYRTLKKKSVYSLNYKDHLGDELDEDDIEIVPGEMAQIEIELTKIEELSLIHI